jgi:hypothetical protein
MSVLPADMRLSAHIPNSFKNTHAFQSLETLHLRLTQKCRPFRYRRDFRAAVLARFSTNHLWCSTPQRASSAGEEVLG